MLNSFDTESGGLSARKLSAFYGVVGGATYVTVKLVKPEDGLYALVAWLLFALLCLGIVTIQNVIELKNGIGKKDSGTGADSVEPK